MPTLFNRFAGCLIGQCLGDALGFPLEGNDPETCAKYVDTNLLANPPLLIGQGEKYAFGQYTDDSQLARELLISIRNCGGLFIPQNYAERIAAMFDQRRIVGYGRATAEAVKRIREGVGWKKSGTPFPAPGNGSAMRAAPIGLLFGPNDKMVQAAHQQSWITHQDPRCSAGSIAIAGAVALLRFEKSLFEETLDPAHFAATLSGWVQEYDPFLADRIRQLPELSQLPSEQALPVLSCRPGDVRYYDEWWGISPYVTESVLWSIYSFLHSPDSYWQTICTAIRVGGDVDTTAAMAGAMSGAYLGLRGVRADPARMLNDRGQWGYLELLALIDEMVDIASLCAHDGVLSSYLPVRGFGYGGMEAEWRSGYHDQEKRFRESFRHLRKFSKDELKKICSESRQ